MSEHFDPQDPRIVEHLRMQVNKLVDEYLESTPIGYK